MHHLMVAFGLEGHVGGVLMTWATIHYVTESTMAVEFGFAERQKNAIKEMTGAEWDKSSKRWLVPVARLGEVVKLFWPELTLDYMVLRARDQALARMFAGYMAMGVRFDVSNGKVVCDHAVLNEWLAANATVLHVNALPPAQTAIERRKTAAGGILAQNYAEAPSVDSEPVSDSQEESRGVALWLRGVQNAATAEEKQYNRTNRTRKKWKSR